MLRYVSLILAITSALATAPGTTSAQVREVPPQFRVPTPPQQELSGPRFGFTAFTGDIARARRDGGKSALMSQFGWQFERQLVSTTDGTRALLEWVVLVGGVEQDEFNMGVSWLAGLRLPNGVEFGVGPHFGVNPDAESATTSMIIAGGSSLPFGEFLVPLNLAVAFAEGGPRITTLIGWIAG